MEEKLILTEEWDKTFPKSNKVSHRKVTFHNRYGITLAADLYEPKNAEGKLAAIAVSGPFGAVKEPIFCSSPRMPFALRSRRRRFCSITT